MKVSELSSGYPNAMRGALMREKSCTRLALSSLLHVVALLNIAGCSSDIAGTAIPGAGIGANAGAPATDGMMVGAPMGEAVVPPPGGEGLGANVFLDQDPRALRRLTNAEYSQALTDLLGEPAGAAARLSFPTDPRSHGFDNNSELVQLSPAHVVAYSKAAEAIAKATFADANRRAMVLKCDTAAPDCLAAYVAELGLKLFRRPLDASEVTSYSALASALQPASADPLSPYQLVLEAMLQSTHFLHVVAVGETVSERPDLVRLNGHELATRLSFFLWGTTPDAELLTAAAQGSLESPAGVASVVTSMLADARARSGLRRFYGQWLPLAQTLTSDPAKLAPGIDVPAMVEEAERFIDDVLWDSGGTVFDLLTARYTFVNGAQASVYGAQAPAPGSWSRFDFSAEPRSGILTQPAILAATAHGEKPSSTRRGQFVQEQLLCTVIAPPPPGISAEIPPAEPGETEREQFARHTTNASCAGCHQLMDPLGWGLGQFDGRGMLRTTDNNGQPVDVSGNAVGLTPSEFQGPVELGQRLRNSPLFTACFAKQLFRYVYGRVDTVNDKPGIGEFEAAFATQAWDFAKGLATIVSNDGFRYRSKGDAP